MTKGDNIFMQPPQITVALHNAELWIYQATARKNEPLSI